MTEPTAEADDDTLDEWLKQGIETIEAQRRKIDSLTVESAIMRKALRELGVWPRFNKDTDESLVESVRDRANEALAAVSTRLTENADD